MCRGTFSSIVATNFTEKTKTMNCKTEYDRQFTEMVRRHEKIIFSVCYFYASLDVPFEDMKQETLLALYNGFRNFRNECKESTWVYRVCINSCIFSQRKLKHRISTVSIENIPTASYGTEFDDGLRERLEWLYKAVSTLNPLDRAVIMMWLDELSYDEIADNMGIPRNTVATRLHRIKDKLSSKKEI